jgi:hypothetical protein
VESRLRTLLRKWRVFGESTTVIAKKVKSTTPATFQALLKLKDEGFTNDQGQVLKHMPEHLRPDVPPAKVDWMFEDRD